MSENRQVDIIDVTAAMMIPDPIIPKKMNLTHEEEQMAYLRLAKGIAVAAIKALGAGDISRLGRAKELFLDDFEETLKVAIDNNYERSKTH